MEAVQLGNENFLIDFTSSRNFILSMSESFIIFGICYRYTTDTLRADCDANWWSTLLQIQNYLNTDGFNHDMCIGPSWYIAADFHLFLIAPFFMYCLRKYERKMVPVIILLLVCGILVSIFSWPLDSTDP